MIVEDVDGDLSLLVDGALVDLVTHEAGVTDLVDVCLILERLARDDHPLAVALLRKSLDRRLQG